MKKLSPKLIWIVLFLATVPTFFTLIRPGFFWMQDDLQAFRIHQMDQCIKDLQIPCRWVPDAGYRYGYPQFNYYPPSVYYLGEAFHLIGLQFIDAVKALFILGFILSSFAMFIFLRAVLGNWPGFVGSMLYTYVPYKAVEVYVRGALSEFYSLAIFPMLFWAVYRLIKTGQIKYIGYLAVFSGLLLLTHNLMAIIFIPVVAAWGLSLVWLKKKWNLLPKIFLGALLGVGLASFFSLPAFLEKEYAHLETLVGGYFDYRAHFVDIKRLLFSNSWGYGSSNIDPPSTLNLSTGIVHWIGALISLILAVLFFKKNPSLSKMALVMGAVEAWVLFMIHRRSSFIWETFTFLEFLQFPWRFLAVSIFLLSLLCAFGTYFLSQAKFKLSVYLGLAMILVVFVLHSRIYQPKDWFAISDQDKFSGKSWNKQLTISIFDYLPIYAKLPPIQEAPPYPEVLSGEALFLSYKKGSNYQTGEVLVKKDAELRLPLFDFPGMKVLANGQVIPHYHDNCFGQEFCLGLISFKLGEGKYIIKTQLQNTPVRNVGNVLSLISIVALGFMFFKYRNETSFS